MEIVEKYGEEVTQIANDASEQFALDHPSIIFIQAAPENVVRFERSGDDLLLTLRNGEQVVVHDFFQQYPDEGRNDLVLQDGEGVFWWGQYTSPWTEFHFTEINWDDPLLLPWLEGAAPGWLAGALGLVGLAAAAGGGGSGASPNRTPVTTDDEGYGLMGESVAGNVLDNDTDADGDTLRVTEFSVGGNTYKPGETASIPGMGDLTVNRDGSYTFEPEPGFHGTVPPVDYTVDDGNGGSDNGTLNIVVNAPPASDAIADQQGNDADDVDLDVSEHFADADDEALTYSAEGLPPGLEMDPETGRISGTVDPSASQGGPGGDGRYEVTVTATDPHGESTSQTFTWSVDNPPPVAADDSNSGLANFPLAGDVLANDSDPDGDILRVTGFTVDTDEDGTPEAFSPGDTATMAGVGTLVINADGSYTFTPEPGWVGQVPPIAYTVSDGEGGEDGAALTLAVGVPAVAIHDNASPADPDVGDDIIANIDDRTAIPLTGQIIPGGTLDSLIVKDEHGNEVRIDPADITIDDDGNFSVMADLSNLGDGRITVELSVTDGSGNTAAATDQILQVTETMLTVNPLLVVDGEAPTITGTGEPGGKVTLVIDGGAPAEVTVDGDGNWSYAPSAPFDPEETTIEASTTDAWGNGAGVERKVPGLTVEDQEGDDSAHVLVDEAGLADGSDPSSGKDAVISTFSLDSSDGDIMRIVIGGSATGGVLTGGTVVTLAQLQDVGATPIDAMSTEYGRITITGYDPDTGVVSYTYALTAAVTHDAPSSGADADKNVVREAILLAVVDGDGDTRVGTLIAGVVDDVPVAVDDADDVINKPDNPSSEATGNVITGMDVADDPDPNRSDGRADAPSADGVAVTGVVAGNGAPADGVDVGQQLSGDYGTLTLNADGSYRYVPNYGNYEVAALKPNETITDTFTYRITDGDGDSDTATLTLSIYGTPAIIGRGDGAVANTDGSVYEAHLADGTDPSSDGAVLHDSFLLVPGPSGLPDGGDRTLRITVGGEPKEFTRAEIEALATEPSEVFEGEYGEFQLTGYDPATGEVSYTYALTKPADQSGGGVNEELLLQFWDKAGDSTGAQPLNIAIVDDAPVITPADDDVRLTADEADLATDPSASFAGLFDTNYGADDPASSSPLTYALGVDTSLSSGLVDTLTGEPVVLAVNGDGTQITGTAGGETVLTIAIDPVTGNVTLDQQRAIEHARSDSEDYASDQISFNPGAINLTATAIDGDMDSVSSTVDIGDRFIFKDDGPNLSMDDSQLGSIEIDEADLTGSGHAVTEADFAKDVFAASYGADGEAGADALVYSLHVEHGASSGLQDTISGEDVLLRVAADGRVEGYAATGGDVVFSAAVDAETGALTLTQYRAVSHPDPDSHDETVALSDGVLSLVATATDGDGDTATASVDVGGKISFRDDGPAVGAPVDATVDEANLALGSAPDPGALTQTGTLGVTASADGIDTQFADVELPSGLKSRGETVHSWISEDGHTVIGYTGTLSPGAEPDASTWIFSAEITDPTDASAGYTFTLHGAVDHAGEATLDIGFAFTVTDGDGDTVTGQFTVTVKDDAAPQALGLLTDEDTPTTFNASADATPDNTTIFQGGNPLVGVDNAEGGKDYATEHGTVTVNADGTITYTPAGNYSGDEPFAFETTDGFNTERTEVAMTMHPVADAPMVEADADTVITDEDTSAPLGFKVPAVTDDTDQNGTEPGDNPERLGLITLAGIPDGVVLQYGAGGSLASTGDPIVIRLTDNEDWEIDSAGAADLEMTRADFEAMKVLPPPNSHENFTVTMSVTSYEVNDAGEPLAGVPGATATAKVLVDVYAVTDEPGLTLDGSVSAGAAGAEALVTTPADPDKDTNAKIEATIKEDHKLDLKSVLVAAFEDADGSESFWYVLEGLPEGTQVEIADITYTAGSDGTIETSPMVVSSGKPAPEFTIKPPLDYSNSSGTPIEARITLNVQDSDSDSGDAAPWVETVSVDLSLRVLPVAGDVETEAVTVAEDTAVAFLQNVKVTDADSAIPDEDTGHEVINEVAFTLPDDWTMTSQPGGGDLSVYGWEVNVSDAHYTITFNDDHAGGAKVLTEAEREAVLAEFEVTPPAHSSKDATVEIRVTTTDTHGADTDTSTKALQQEIEVTPVAEKVDGDSDGDGDVDLTMTESHDYVTPGEENQWFALKIEGFDPSSGWFNQDTDEKTYARLTPHLIAGDGGEDTPYGSQLRWSEDGGTTWEMRTYNGNPIDVPVEFLDTLQFKAKKDFSGSFDIKVQAYTVDYDEDHPGDASLADTAVSGEAWLKNILVKPVAGKSTTTVTAGVLGDEDEPMDLSIRPSSSDPSETFDVTISDIPNGAKLIYGGYTLTQDGIFDADGNPVSPAPDGIAVATDGASQWQVTFANYQADDLKTITPPEDSNAEFTLTVSTVTVDELVIPEDSNSPYRSTTESDPEVLTIVVSPKGVADAAIFELADDLEFAEADVDQAGIAIRDLIEKAELKDDDSSETLTFKIGGLPVGFGLEGGIFLGGADEGRQWSLTAAQIEDAVIQAPANYNGKLEFSLYTITTENDGDSLTQEHRIEVAVTPSPEATMRLATTAAEDVSTKLDFSVQHQGGDNDEVISEVWIRVNSVDSNITLTLGADGSSLAKAAGVSGSGVVLNGGYYKISGSAMDDIHVQGASNWSGTANFAVRYQVTDPGHDGLAAVARMSGDHTYVVTVTPVTDPVTLDVIEGADTTLTGAGDVTVKLAVGNDDGGGSHDYDGSERLTRIIVEDVPDGVVLRNDGVHFLGDGKWVIVTDEMMDGPLAPELELRVSSAAGGLDGHAVRITVVSEDGGNGQMSTAETTIALTTDFSAGVSAEPAEIMTWEQSAFEPTEDTSFALTEAMIAEIGDGVADSGFTIMLAGLPEGTGVGGMVQTTVDGQPVWIASGMGGNAELQALLEGIEVTPPANWNSNHGSFDYSATLTTHVPSGGRAQQTTVLEQAVAPDTDEAQIAIDAAPVEEGNELPIHISIGNAADDPNWTLIDDVLYLQLDDAGMGGALKNAIGQSLQTERVEGVDGVADGDYYVITLYGNTSVDLTYVPSDAHASGDVTIAAWVRGQEEGAANVVATEATVSTEVEPVNSGYDFDVESAEGKENASASDKGQAIEIRIADAGLIDDDGSEQIDTILLGKVPNGFLVFVGDSEANASVAEMANNAGGSGTNTWLLGEEMPGYVAILPPRHWSGTVEGLELTVISGEQSLSEKNATTETFDLTVTPVADGVTLEPTASFGTEGEIIGFNLNARMTDLAPAGALDESTETATVEIRGLGEGAGFYIGDTPVSQVDGVDAVFESGVYTITGLSQDAMDQLGFVQTNAVIGTIEVRAQTVESGAPDEPSGWTEWETITADISGQLATTGNDALLWTGGLIDGLDGLDTLVLHKGENLSGDQLADFLTSVEQIDLSVDGTNQIIGLTPDDVWSILGPDNSGGDTLSFLGTGDDSVQLDGSWTSGPDNTWTATAAGGQDVSVQVLPADPLADDDWPQVTTVI